MKRLMIYCFYDSDGIVEDYVQYFLKSFKPHCKEICTVINGFVTKESEIKLNECADKVLIRENFGYDACAYKFGIESYGYEEIKKYDELIIANSTFYGPIFPPSDLFDKMDNKAVDFWGITKYPKSNYKMANVEVNEHIQSYFISIRKSILESASFKAYWETLKIPNSYSEAIAFHELRFSKFFAEKNFKYDSYIDLKKYENKMKSHIYFYPICQQVEEDRMPFIKRKIFIEAKGLFYNYIEKDPLYLLDYVRNNTNYDINLIINDIERTSLAKDTGFIIFVKFLYCFFCLIFLFWQYKHYIQKIEALATFTRYKRKLKIWKQ